MHDKTIYLYTGNHKSLDGIDDFITLVQRVYAGRANVVLSKDIIADEKNIVIDEFTNYLSNSEISRVKTQSPDTKILLMLTEFVESQYFVESFNHFDGVLTSSVISFLNLYFKAKRSDFPSLNVKDWLTAFILSPIFAYAAADSLCCGLFEKGKSQRDAFRVKYGFAIYMHMRYLGLKSHIKYFDAVVLSHPSIFGDNKKGTAFSDAIIPNFGTLYPVFDESILKEPILQDKVLRIEITGSKSAYRQYWAKLIDKLVNRYCLTGNFEYVYEKYFNVKRKKTIVGKSAFSLHPPQKHKWKYASPTRIFRAVGIDKNIPILTKHFKQHPIEDIAMVWHGIQTLEEMYTIFQNKDEFEKGFKARIAQYNALTTENNKKVIDLIDQM